MGLLRDKINALKGGHIGEYWCSTVLPLVYDDSLSYYEAICKLYKYVGGLLSDVNKLSDKVDALGNGDSIANEALAKATQADEKAGLAITKSNSAIETANGIDSKATQALSKSESADAASIAAIATANGVDGKATQALEKATKAEADATEALTKIDQVIGGTIGDGTITEAKLSKDVQAKINKASTDAAGALTSAADAETDATEALNTANRADGNATQAKADASAATDTANIAIEDAATANGKADQAVGTANQALAAASRLATAEAVGGIKASPKTGNETGECKIGNDGKLYAPASGGGGKPKEKIAEFQLDFGVEYTYSDGVQNGDIVTIEFSSQAGVPISAQYIVLPAPTMPSLRRLSIPAINKGGSLGIYDFTIAGETVFKIHAYFDSGAVAISRTTVRIFR